jgi:Dolichyl-phosphate-mannose-protein mannosyltransferase
MENHRFKGPNFLRGLWFRIFAAFLVTVGVGLLAASTTSFGTMRGWVDLSAADGAAEPYTPALHLRLQVGAALCGVILVVVGIIAWRLQQSVLGQTILAKLNSAWSQSYNEHRHILRRMWALTLRYRWPILLTLLIGAIARASIVFEPIRFDEAISWRDYSIRPLWVVASLYDQPNNHVFHNLVMGLFIRLFGDSLLAIRATSLIASGATLFLVAIIAGRIAGSWASGVAGLFVATNSSFAEYSCYARGYSLLAAFSLMSASLLYLAIVRRNRSAGVWSVVFAAFGLWTIPLMAYPIVFLASGAIVYLLLDDSRSSSVFLEVRLPVLTIMKWGFAVICLAAVMYLPVLIVSGPKSLLSNTYVRSQSFGSWLNGVSQNGFETFALLARDMPILGLLLVILVLVSGVLVDRHVRRLILSALLAGIFVVAVVMAQRVHPPARTWLWIVPFIAIALGVFCSAVNRWAVKLPFGVRACLIVVMVVTATALPFLNLVNRNAVRQSNEGGKCLEAPVAAIFLKTYVLPAEPIIATCPAAATLDYACHRQGIAAEHFVPPKSIGTSAIVVVVQDAIYDQSVDEVLRSYTFADQFAGWKRELAWRQGALQIFRLSKP